MYLRKKMENQSHHFTDSNLRATSLQNHAFNLLNLMDRTDESRMALDRFKKEREGLLKRQEEASGTKRLVSPRFSFSSKYVSHRSSLSPNEQCSEGKFRTYTSTPAVHPKVGHIFDPNPRNKLSIYHPSSSSNNIDNRPCSWSSDGGKNKRKAQHSLVAPEVSPSPPSIRIRHSVGDGYRGVHKGYQTFKVQEKSSESISSHHDTMKMKAPISNCCRCNRVNKSERERAEFEDSFPPSIPTLDSFDLCYKDDEISVWSFDETHSPVNTRNSLSFHVED